MIYAMDIDIEKKLREKRERVKRAEDALDKAASNRDWSVNELKSSQRKIWVLTQIAFVLGSACVCGVLLAAGYSGYFVWLSILTLIGTVVAVVYAFIFYEDQSHERLNVSKFAYEYQVAEKHYREVVE